MSLAFARAAELDARDPLARFRERFLIADPDEVYLDGNSLGRMPLAARDAVARAVNEEWGERLIGGWNDRWWELSRKVGDKVGRLLGADAGEVILADSVSVNIFKLLGALVHDCTRIVVDATNFPSDLYIAQGVTGLRCEGCIDLHLLSLSGMDPETDEEIICKAIAKRRSIVLLSHVNFRTGARFDMRRINDVAARNGSVVVWDFSHSVGAVPINVREEGVRAAVGCTYKYLNGGPGSPAFLYVERDLADTLHNPVSGWFGHARPFAMGLDYEPAQGTARFLCGTTPILSATAVEAGIDITLEAGIGAIWKKAESLMDLFRELTEGPLTAHGARVVTPLGAHGSHVSIAHEAGWQVCQALLARKIVPDFRPPNMIRFGFAPLYTSHVEVMRAATTLMQVLASQEWRGFPAGAEKTVT